MILYRNKCFRRQGQDGHYKVCLYEQAAKGNASLGSWTSLSHTNYYPPSDVREKMGHADNPRHTYAGGVACPNDATVSMSARLLFACAAQETLVRVIDRGCSVTFVLAIPEVCRPQLIDDAKRIQAMLPPA
mmetsp:Transcript_12714/g.46943  ORF Transcript_12714/g.46943 Transcript_12714/m.46943 type:complete len:131 (+) Transcript_12714:23-415(+)